MAKKLRIVIPALVVMGVSVFLYIAFRIQAIEKNLLRPALKQSYRLVLAPLAKNKDLDWNDREILTNAVKDITEKHPELALIAIADFNYQMKISIKNDRYVESVRLLDSIIHNFMNGRFNKPRERQPVTAYYDIETGGKEKQLKFYLFSTALNEHFILVGYPYRLGTRLVTRVGLEISLIAILIVIASVLIYIRSNKETIVIAKTANESGENASKIRDELGQPAAEGYASPPEEMIIEEITDNYRSESSIQGKDQQTAPEIDPIPAPAEPPLPPESLNGLTYEMLSSIYEKYGPDTITVYTPSDRRTVSRKYEMRGDSFTRYTDEKDDVIDITSAVGQELRNASIMIINSGREVVLPLIRNNNFLGTLRMLRHEAFKGSEISGVQEEITHTLARIEPHILSEQNRQH